ncbi:MAG TPA: helix-turn-helix transcriptional regulator [Candidatus Eisenbacteria bacterium]|nr:helix-turn-helix transcriptional regulator [Candidatus Eisenbacteria bacterium]
MIGERLRDIRREKKLSQGDLEERTGLSRCYLSRIENGHTTPSIETLEKLAGAMQVQLYQLFYQGNGPAKPLVVPRQKDAASEEWGLSGKWGGFVNRMRGLLGQMEESDRKLLLGVAVKLSRKK